MVQIKRSTLLDPDPRCRFEDCPNEAVDGCYMIGELLLFGEYVSWRPKACADHHGIEI